MFSWNNWWNHLSILLAWWNSRFPNLVTSSPLEYRHCFRILLFRRVYINQCYFFQIHLLSYWKEISLQVQKIQLHDKQPLLHQRGWCFTFTTESLYCKVVVFLRVEQNGDLPYLFVRVVVWNWCHLLVTFGLLMD